MLPGRQDVVASAIVANINGDAAVATALAAVAGLEGETIRLVVAVAAVVTAVANTYIASLYRVHNSVLVALYDCCYTKGCK